ncbi:sulfatase [Luteitalea sp. TBR-22]|uniref:LTA synthase family protein n=1 Tax=Luteitalea sp. TBR-22 TaxID=2802971 RepID=UPI001AF1584E|nr:LTA synthase family protein [Luteitalea sp. TBR-22]BCS31218.1 sulfatase [Luteitalea sp. TBR-22]
MSLTAVTSPPRQAFLTRYRQRARLVGRVLAIQLALSCALRLALVTTFGDTSVAGLRLIGILAAGTAGDLLVAITAALPWLLVLSLFRLRWLGSGRVQHLLVAGVGAVLAFESCVQYFFFEEYSARYNHLALDYLMYPDEVFGNIFASYDVPSFAGLALVVGAALAVATAAWPRAVLDDWRWRDRLAGGVLTAGLAAMIAGAWTIVPDAFASGRLANELALNGWAQLVRAAITSHLDYEAYYALLPAGDASARVRRLVAQSDPSRGLVRHFEPRRHRASGPLDVVVILEESLGSSFSARFGQDNDESVTPELDRWSREGIALTGVIANGNRTVRGLEGVLCSFLPLPGDAIVKRDRSENVASMARILAARGYDTTFFYGGYGLFDNVKSFMTGNGYREFVEQPDYPADAFRTVWGVADEVVFDALIARHKAARAAGRRWFGTALTVSNHKPFDVPAGRVSWPATGASKRRGAVLYADWALGRYLSQARAAGLLDGTVVLIVGDHGARVYGAEEIPVTSYRIPAVFLTPDAGDRGVVIDRLASQVDLAPTLLSLAGIAYDAPFFGLDVLGLPDDGGRAFVNHNRSIGLLTDTNLAVLGLHRSLALYTRPDRHSDGFVRVTKPTPELAGIADDAKAAFQTAYVQYQARAYRLPSSSAPAPAPGPPPTNVARTSGRSRAAGTG